MTGRASNDVNTNDPLYPSDVIMKTVRVAACSKTFLSYKPEL